MALCYDKLEDNQETAFKMCQECIKTWDNGIMIRNLDYAKAKQMMGLYYRKKG